MCFDFLYNFCLKYCSIQGEFSDVLVFIYTVIHLKYTSLTKPEFSWETFQKFSDIKFYEDPSGLSRIVLCRQTDFAFHNFSNAPEKWQTSF
jgi:hypothetical protein